MAVTACSLIMIYSLREPTASTIERYVPLLPPPSPRAITRTVEVADSLTPRERSERRRLRADNDRDIIPVDHPDLCFQRTRGHVCVCVFICPAFGAPNWTEFGDSAVQGGPEILSSYLANDSADKGVREGGVDASRWDPASRFHVYRACFHVRYTTRITTPANDA